MIDFSRNHFQLFDLPQRYRLDAAALDAAYRSLDSGLAEWVAIRGARELDLVSLSAPSDAPLAESM